MEIRIAQPGGGDTIQRRRRDHAAESGGRGKADIVGHYQQDIRSALGWYDLRRPPRLRLHHVMLDYTTEFQRWRRELFPVKRHGGVGGTRYAGDLLGRNSG